AYEECERFAHRDLADLLLDIHLRVRAERGGGRLDRGLVARREGAKRVLHAVAELPEHLVRHVERVLRDEVDADTLRPDEAHDLLDTLEELVRRFGEEEVRLGEEEDERRVLGVAYLGELLEELGEEPQEERRVD